MAAEFEGKVALVTGGSRGLGPHIAKELARAGADVAVTARSADRLNELAEVLASDLGVNTLAIPVDLTDIADRTELVDMVERKLGPIDILANVAGIARANEFDREDERKIVETNLTAPIHLMQLVAPGMTVRKFGRILNVASLAGKVGLPYLAAYSATKAGLISYSLSIREELRGTGVTSTVVSPGFIVDEGMYVPYATPVPWYLGSNRSATVARKAVRALRRNRAEVIVNRLPMRPLITVGAIHEPVMRGTTRSLGATDFLEGLSAKELGYSGEAPALSATEPS